MRRLAACLVISCSILIVGLIGEYPVAADHLTRNQQALGKPEHDLSGVEVRSTADLVFATPINQVVKRFGPPTSTQFEKGSFASEKAGQTKYYIWIKNGVKTRVTTDFSNGVESGVYSVDVWGHTVQDHFGVTGRGLSLGESIDQQRRLYGNRYYVSSRREGKIRSTLLQWADGSQLSIDYDSKGTIEHMQLMAEIE